MFIVHCNIRILLGVFLAASLAASAMANATNAATPVIRRAVAADILDVSPVWAGHPVGFALLTHAPFQFAAFYDGQRRLTVAQRRLDSREWKLNRLPDTTGWDSHNFIALAADGDGYLHLSGDMHVMPLKYFRTAKPLDAATFERVDRMTGLHERKVTYPQFIHGPNHQLIFTYRDGGSGNGNQIYDAYDLAAKTWKPLFDGPLTDGEGRRNAYYDGPILGPDGWYHLAWVWRESPDASSNHDLSYARSRDLVHWETSGGKPLKVPITLETGEIVDPVPAKGGLANGNAKIGFDDRGRVTISYHKNDRNGYTQPWTARLENGVWHFYQITDWPYNWDFGGGGSLEFGIRLGAVRKEPNGWLIQSFDHVKFGAGTWRIDPNDLHAMGLVECEETPPALGPVQSAFPGMMVHWASDAGSSGQAGISYKLRWETLDAHRDAPREGPLPPASMLKLVEIKTVSP